MIGSRTKRLIGNKIPSLNGCRMADQISLDSISYVDPEQIQPGLEQDILETPLFGTTRTH